jgi:C4-dicarboxylate-specific signal transduction histidine kinase
MTSNQSHQIPSSSYEKLEQVIKERTADLQTANDRLQVELAERIRAENLLHEKTVELEQEIGERQCTQDMLTLKNRQLEELNLSLEDRVQSSLTQLRQKDQLLIQQNRLAAVGEMLNNIAHQWRQPLNSLGLLLASLREAWEIGKLNGEYLEKALTTGSILLQNMSSTISDFSNFSRPDRERKPFSALIQVNTAITVVLTSYRNQGIDITQAPSDDVILTGFPNEYCQVLLNLLANARDAIVNSGQTAGSISIRLFEQDGSGCVTVRDNGGGIPDDIISRIYDPYFSGKESGTGIGLYMSKMIIERSMAGCIRAYNIADGAEFLIKCPLATEIRP